MILGISIVRGRTSAMRGSGWCLLDERRGEFMALGVLPSGSARDHELIDRWAVVANLAARCETIVVNAESKQLRAVAKLCADPMRIGGTRGTPEVVTIADDRWRAATMVTVPPSERSDQMLVYAAASHILKAHSRALAQFDRLPTHRLVVASTAVLVALGGALTITSLKARVLSEQRYEGPNDDFDPEDERVTRRDRSPTAKRGVLIAPDGSCHVRRARLELVEHRGEPEYETKVLNRARLLARASDAQNAARAAKLSGATTPPEVDPGERSLINGAKRDLASFDVPEKSPRYQELLASLIEKRRARTRRTQI